MTVRTLEKGDDDVLALVRTTAFAWLLVERERLRSSRRGRQPAAPPAQLSALALANLAKPRPKPPFDLTGMWQHDGRANTWRFVPETFKLTPEAQVHYDRGVEGAEGRRGLSRRHRAVLAGRPAADHDAGLADRDDSAADGRST